MDQSTIITAVIVAIPPTLTALAALRKIKTLHVEINSRMTELLKVTREAGFAAGGAQERADAKERAV